MVTFRLQSGQVTTIATGGVGAGLLGSGVVVSGNIASGQLGSIHHASGQLTGFELGSGSIVSGRIASGQIGKNHLASGAVNSGHNASGNVITYARLHLEDGKLAGQAISGVVAVCLGSGGQYVLPAERQSGLRLPAIGVSTTNALSGQAVSVCLLGFVPAASGTIASGGGPLFVGSGGLLVNLSGFMGGTSSGPGVGSFSGSYVQQVGLATSGGIYVLPELSVGQAKTSGAYLNPLSGGYPASGALGSPF